MIVVALSLALAELWALFMGRAGISAFQIIALTTLSIGASLHAKVRALTLSYRLGMYLIYVFCLAVSSMVRLVDA